VFDLDLSYCSHISISSVFCQLLGILVLMKTYKNIDEYISNFPTSTQEILKKIRSTIQKVAPEATEKISYGIPTFWQGKNVVHFAAYEGHIGFYPGAQPIVEFADKLKEYDTSKGTVRFPLDKPIPYDLIEEITLYCVNRNNK